MGEKEVRVRNVTTGEVLRAWYSVVPGADEQEAVRGFIDALNREHACGTQHTFWEHDGVVQVYELA